jgi:hypothetical protein
MTQQGHVPLASREIHRRRLVSAGKVGIAMIVASLAIGIVGYMTLEGLGFIDAFLNASMILSGMGPLHNPTSTAGKVFAGLYALYSGFAVLAIAAIMFAPIIHRIFHRLHVADSELEQKAGERTDAKPEAKRRKKR